MEADLDLADVNAELAKRHGRGVPYKHLWEACVEQRVPARRVGRSWRIRRRDVDRVAEIFGLNSPVLA
jgi:hypothetical protein